jgi:hypothetical protein
LRRADVFKPRAELRAVHDHTRAFRFHSAILPQRGVS